MGGFKNTGVNYAFAIGAVNTIINQLIKCSEQLKDDSANSDIFLPNHEDKITNILTAEYLNAGLNLFRYEPQSSENYNESSNTYIGRTDIKVTSLNYYINSKSYFVIECKRIDGTAGLNIKYITDGVARFVGNSPKYSSYYGMNIMFGYVVHPLDIEKNALEIECLQNSHLIGVSADTFILMNSKKSQHYLFSCEYASKGANHIELRHLFFDFSSIVR